MGKGYVLEDYFETSDYGFLIFNSHLRICLLILEKEEGGEREGEGERCERETSVSCLP